MRGIIYIRVSSDEQVDGTSLASQEELCLRYCDQKRIEPVKVFREEGESAKSLALKNRGVFLSALEFCRKQRPAIDAFVVFRVDRFARNTEDHFAVRRILNGFGTTLHSVTEPIGNSPAEKFTETLLAGAAEYDNAVRKQRCTDGMIARINQGIWPFKPPIGYLCAHHRQRGEKKTTPDEPDVQLFDLIRRGLRLYASGEIASPIGLVRCLNQWGFSLHSGKPASAQLVDRILGRNLPFYAGLLVNPWDQREVKGRHVAMISDADLAMIRARRTGRVPIVPSKHVHWNPDFPLRRLVRCCRCGRRMTAAASKGNGGTYGYYFCINRACERRFKGIRSSNLHTSFTTFLRSFELDQGTFEGVERAVRTIWESHASPAQMEAKRRSARLTDLRERRVRILEMREDGSYDAATFRDRLAQVDADIAVIAAELSTTRTISELSFDEAVDATRWFLNRASELWRQLPSVGRDRFEKIAFPAGIRSDDGLEFRTTEIGPILALSRSIHGCDSAKVVLSGLCSNQSYEYFKTLIDFHREMTKEPTALDDLGLAA